MRLSGRTAVVTGAASGIGLATAHLLANEGARVACADVNGPGAERAAEQIRCRGGEAMAVEVDVAREEEVEALIRRVLEQWGRLDIMVNNAGVEVALPVTETTSQEWERVMGVNARGVFYGCKHAIAVMARQGGGVIVNVASVAGLRGLPLESVYCASKAAVVLLTRSLAVEWARAGIRINCVCPGAVRTPLLEAAVARAVAAGGDPESSWQRIAQMHPMGAIAEPEDVARAILFLASDDARMITGVALPVDGGWSAALYVG